MSSEFQAQVSGIQMINFQNGGHFEKQSCKNRNIGIEIMAMKLNLDIKKSGFLMHPVVLYYIDNQNYQTKI